MKITLSTIQSVSIFSDSVKIGIYMAAVSYCSWRLFPFILENLITKTCKGNIVFLTLP